MTTGAQLSPLDIVRVIGRRALTFPALVRLLGADRQLVAQLVHEAIRDGWVVTQGRDPATAGYGPDSRWPAIERHRYLVLTSLGLEVLA